jgi:hypothetical protein
MDMIKLESFRTSPLRLETPGLIHGRGVSMLLVQQTGVRDWGLNRSGRLAYTTLKAHIKIQQCMGDVHAWHDLM